MRTIFRSSNEKDGEAGLYAWDLGSDTFYADSALAELFGMDEALAERGLPVARYLERIHVDDRSAIAGAKRHAIMTGAPFQESYRVHGASGEFVRIVDFGRCFRDAGDQPRFYAGIVFPMAREMAGDDGLLWQCMAALEAAQREGRDDVSAMLVDVIRKLVDADLAVAGRLVS